MTLDSAAVTRMLLILTSNPWDGKRKMWLSSTKTCRVAYTGITSPATSCIVTAAV